MSEIRVSEIRVSEIRGSEIRVSEIRISSNHRELHGAIFCALARTLCFRISVFMPMKWASFVPVRMSRTNDHKLVESM